MTQTSLPTRLSEYITAVLPWAHAHQRKAITAFVAAIIDTQTGCQAELARTFGNQEAACKRISRLIHNERLSAHDLAEAVCRQALSQVPPRGRVRVTIDWTSEGTQHLLIVSLVVGRRGLPIYWRSYDESVLKGRMQRYELAVLRRAFKLILRVVKAARVRLTADRGFADTALFDLLDELQIRYIIRVKGNVQVEYQGEWRKLNTLGFEKNSRRRNLGRIRYCFSSPRRLFVSMTRARDKKGKWGIWQLISNHVRRAEQMAGEYAFRFSCEEGFRDAKWYLGFKQARVKKATAWGRLFALFAIALQVVISLGMRVLIGNKAASQLLRGVISRRRGRCELSLVAAMVSLLHQVQGLFEYLSPTTKFNLEASLSNVS